VRHLIIRSCCMHVHLLYLTSDPSEIVTNCSFHYHLRNILQCMACQNPICLNLISRVKCCHLNWVPHHVNTLRPLNLLEILFACLFFLLHCLLIMLIKFCWSSCPVAHVVLTAESSLAELSANPTVGSIWMWMAE